MLLGLVRGHRAERRRDDRRLVDLGDAVGRDALGEQELGELVVGLLRLVRAAEIVRQLVRELGVFGLLDLLKGLCGAFAGGLGILLLAPIRVGEQHLLFLPLLVEARIFGGVFLGQRLPVNLRPLVGEGALQRRPGLLPPLGGLGDRRVGALDILRRLGAHRGGLAGLLVRELDPLLLVLLQDRPQLGRHGIPGRLVLGAPEFGGLALLGRGFRFFVGSFVDGIVPFAAAFGLDLIALVPIGGRCLFSLVFAGFAKIGHQRYGLGEVHGLGAPCPVRAGQIFCCWKALISRDARPIV